MPILPSYQDRQVLLASWLGYRTLRAPGEVRHTHINLLLFYFIFYYERGACSLRPFFS